MKPLSQSIQSSQNSYFKKGSLFKYALALASAMPLISCGGGGSSSTVSAGAGTDSAASTPVVTGVGPSFMAELNKVRVACGLQPLRWNGALALSAQSHEQYLSANSEFSHTENPSLTGFTGVSWSDRIAFRGYSSAIDSETIIFGQNYTDENARASVYALLNSLAHRATMLAPDFTDIGVSSQAPVVADYGRPYGTGFNYPVISYPYNNQPNVGVSFANPGSMPGLVNPIVGSPISVSSAVFSSFALKDFSMWEKSTSEAVPTVSSPNIGMTSSNHLFFPQDSLKFKTTYVYTYSVVGASTRQTVEFTTN